ncbi:MAG: ATP-dependent DNA helicase RecG [Gammaproteobacteria bacterium]|nr:ATP-dependent DNA helicase RecG [Gammaproteobacteria bacterium]
MPGVPGVRLPATRPATVTLDDPVARLRGVGPRVAEKLAKLRIVTVRDLVFHLPLRYQDRTRIVPIGRLRPKMEVVIEGTIEASQLQYGKRRSLLCRLGDGTGAITLRFFHFTREQQVRLAVGRKLRCFGEVRFGPSALEIVHPECQFIEGDLAPPPAVSLTPVYGTTDGLHQLTLRRLTDQALASLGPANDGAAQIDEHIARVLHGRIPPLHEALHYVHRPPHGAPIDDLLSSRHPAQQRLACEELVAHQLSLRRLRLATRRHGAPRLKAQTALRAKIAQGFGFALTRAQQRVVAEIDRDLAAGVPMLRLLQGDVGAGKTAVAALVAAGALEAGYKVALLAPTELLAEQHARNLERWFAPHGVESRLLAGKLGRAARRQVLERLVQDEPILVVGTHALFQADVAYTRLGIVVVDEQHRFGVDQRLALLEKGATGDARPHQLIMTATPIPRTLAMTAYADLDVSVLDELPPNRQPVRTVVVPEDRRGEIVERIAAACAAGRQTYWVCPLIEESEVLEAQAASETFDQLAAALPQLRVGLVHGRMPDKEKDGVMRGFVGHEIDLLVATTVIEVGVDVPNASLMVIENAERLGLSQLHQLRGRVGRGAEQSDCVLLYKAPLSETARHRLQVMRETNDGFVIAERDLQLRGPGELLGTRQTGLAGFRIADPLRDRALIPAVQRVADELLAGDPALVDRIICRWLGQGLDYAKV